MKKEHLVALFEFIMMSESIVNNRGYKSSLNPTLEISAKEERVPKGCKKFIIGKYSVIAINRKNAIRKVLKLRRRDFNCC